MSDRQTTPLTADPAFDGLFDALARIEQRVRDRDARVQHPLWVHEGQRAFEAYREPGDCYWLELSDDEQKRWERVGREFTP